MTKLKENLESSNDGIIEAIEKLIEEKFSLEDFSIDEIRFSQKPKKCKRVKTKKYTRDGKLYYKWKVVCE